MFLHELKTESKNNVCKSKLEQHKLITMGLKKKLVEIEAEHLSCISQYVCVYFVRS